MTLTIYLDTQDYIALFNEHPEGPHHQVLATLLARRDRGEIAIGFSFATIMEFITKPDDAHRSKRVRRGQLVKDICGRNAFPFPSAMANFTAFSNDGMWMINPGESFISARECRKLIRNAYMDALKDMRELNRHQRRNYGRKSSMIDLMNKVGYTWGNKRSDWGDLPVSDEIIHSEIMERFIRGQCSDKEFEDRINSWLSDPAEFSKIFYEYGDQPNMIEKFFGNITSYMEQTATDLQDLVSEIRRCNSAILGTRQRLVAEGMEKSEARRLTKQISLPSMKSRALDGKRKTDFGETFTSHFAHYLERILKLEHTFKKSDVMDLFQLCYAYDCDLFRCDKAMANTFRDFRPLQGKLVEQFSELPQRIEAIIGASE